MVGMGAFFMLFLVGTTCVVLAGRGDWLRLPLDGDPEHAYTFALVMLPIVAVALVFGLAIGVRYFRQVNSVLDALVMLALVALQVVLLAAVLFR
jgi:hypothetical protein